MATRHLDAWSLGIINTACPLCGKLITVYPEHVYTITKKGKRVTFAVIRVSEMLKL